MIREIVLLLGCTLIAYFYQNSRIYLDKIDEVGRVKTVEMSSSKVLFFVLSCILICHSGLRTYMNDTANYIASFSWKIASSLSAISELDWSIGANPFFNAYEILLKVFISDSGYVFIFISSLIPVVLYLRYFRKHAESFALSIYVFIAFCAYGFTMVAIKQSIATSIALWAIDCVLEKRNIKGIIIMAIAMLFHPYAIILLIHPVLSNSVWDKKTILIIIVTAICGATFSRFTSLITSMTSSIFGDNYSSEVFSSGTGLKLVRFFVYAAVPIVSFVCKNNIKKMNNRYINLCINASIISACFVFVGLFGGGIALGRMANFFDVFTCLAVCYIVCYGFNDYSQRKLLTTAIVVCFFAYYFVYNWKYHPSWFGDMYSHISIFRLLSEW